MILIWIAFGLWLWFWVTLAEAVVGGAAVPGIAAVTALQKKTYVGAGPRPATFKDCPKAKATISHSDGQGVWWRYCYYGK